MCSITIERIVTMKANYMVLDNINKIYDVRDYLLRLIYEF